jgi:hypothetical protein
MPLNRVRSSVLYCFRVTGTGHLEPGDAHLRTIRISSRVAPSSRVSARAVDIEIRAGDVQRKTD